MTSIFDGFSYGSTLENQIYALKNQTAGNQVAGTADDANLALQQSFDKIISGLLSSSSDKNSNSLLTDASTLETQINLLRKQGESGIPADPNEVLLTIQQNINKITIENFFNDSKDEEEEDNIFSSWSSYQSSMNYLKNPQAQSSLNNLTTLQNNLSISANENTPSNANLNNLAKYYLLNATTQTI